MLENIRSLQNTDPIHVPLENDTLLHQPDRANVFVKTSIQISQSNENFSVENCPIKEKYFLSIVCRKFIIL